MIDGVSGDARDPHPAGPEQFDDAYRAQEVGGADRDGGSALREVRREAFGRAGVALFGIMSISFLFLVPAALGFIVV